MASKMDAYKKTLVRAGARALFYPTLGYNVLRSKLEPHFSWWDQIDEAVLLGAVPFKKDVLTLKEHGVGGVITLTEPFETLVPKFFYEEQGIENLVIPTTDFAYAPSLSEIDRAIDFIINLKSLGKKTYVHCKAGRGRSTTVVLCYLVRHKNMNPDTAMDLIRAIRPRVQLHDAQEQAVRRYYYERDGIVMVTTADDTPPDVVDGQKMKSKFSLFSPAFGCCVDIRKQPNDPSDV